MSLLNGYGIIEKLMNNKIIWAIIIIIILGVGGWYYSKSKISENVGSVDSSMPVPNAGTKSAEAVVETVATKEFTVTGKDFSFSPNSITVSKGDRVKIILKNEQGFHDLRVDGFDVGTEQIKAGGESSFEFVADKAGSFEYYCSVGSHRAKGMVGALVVE